MSDIAVGVELEEGKEGDEKVTEGKAALGKSHVLCWSGTGDGVNINVVPTNPGEPLLKIFVPFDPKQEATYTKQTFDLAESQAAIDKLVEELGADYLEKAETAKKVSEYEAKVNLKSSLEQQLAMVEADLADDEVPK